MKFVSIRDYKASLSSYLAESQRQRVIVTRHGKPVSLVVGIEGYDIEDALTLADPDFWKMIEERRQNPRTLSLAQARKRFAAKKKEKGSDTGT